MDNGLAWVAEGVVQLHYMAVRQSVARQDAVKGKRYVTVAVLRTDTGAGEAIWTCFKKLLQFLSSPAAADIEREHFNVHIVVCK